MEEAPLLDALQSLRAGDGLCTRIALYRQSERLSELAAAGTGSGSGDEWLRVAGVKVFLDGTLGSQTAWLHRPHENSAAGCGISVLSPGELSDLVRRASDAQVACAIHAIGDRANSEALRALAGVRSRPGRLPHRVEHAQLLRPRDIPRFARLGIIASMQLCHIPGDIDAAERYWGRRSRYAYAIGSLLRAGATVVLGSDAPVATASALRGIHAAVQRQTLDGRPAGGWHREERIGVMPALRAYTVAPAAATGESSLKGKLLPGYLADIVVLSHDITRLRGARLLDVRVDVVVVGGRVRHRRRGAG
jgi:predicted amidohydrolase YtcJ